MLSDSGRAVAMHVNLHMTIEEWKLIMKHVKKTCKLKWFVFLNLLSFRGMRPLEALAINVMDFYDTDLNRRDFTKLTYREAKTNKLRAREHIIPALAKLLETYCAINNYFAGQDGYLFYHYKVRHKGMPHIHTRSATAWFKKDVRDKLKKDNPSFREWYPVYQKDGQVQKRYRINLYSFRRFFETYIYLNNEFAPRSVALIKELMEYNSKFDPIKHYIKVCHREEQKSNILDNTLTPLAMAVTEGQTTLGEY